jgi:eukaryotic-like serine/threonine-protein kinase
MNLPPEKEYWVVCPVCHKANPAGTKYCKYCWGAALSSQKLVAAEDLDTVLKKIHRQIYRRKLIFGVGITAGAVVIAALISFWILYRYTDALAPIQKGLNSNSGSNEWAMFRHDTNNSGVTGPTDILPEGTLKWKFTTGKPIHSSAAVVGDTVYFGSQDWKLYAVDVQTGQEKWEFQAQSRVQSSPAVVDGIVYFGSNDGHMYGLDAETGKEIWKYKTRYAVTSSPAVADGKVFFGADDYHVYALDAKTGKELWKFTTLGQVGSSPTVVDGLVYIGSGVEYTYVLNASNGFPRLNFKMYDSVYGSPAVVGNTAYVCNYKGDLYVFRGDARNWPLEYELKPYWMQVWAFGLAPAPPIQSGFLWGLSLGQPIDTCAAISGDQLFVGSGTDLVGVDLQLRKKIWSFTTGDKVLSSPAVLDSAVITGSNDGYVYAVNPDTGEKIWAYQTQGPVSASPTVANGVIFIGSEDGTMYALE